MACRGECGTKDTTSRWSAVARLCMVERGQDPTQQLCSGSTVTFIEDDVVASEAHVVGYTPEEKDVWSACCDAEGGNKADVCTFGSSSQSRDLQGKDVYIAAGADTTTLANTKIIGKIIKYAARSTGNPPGYDIFVGHVDRSCTHCVASAEQPTIKPIPLASKYPVLNEKATWVYTAGTGDTEPADATWPGRKYAYRQSSPHTLNKVIGSGYEGTEQCRRQAVAMNKDPNPLAVSDTSGSPVFFTQCDKDVLHGFHGNGEGGWCFESEISSGSTGMSL